MLKRSIIASATGVLGIGLVVLIITGFDPTALLLSPAPPSPTATSKLPFKTGDLREYYFSERELADLGLADRVDPAEVRYRADLEQDAFSPGCASKDCILSIDEPEFVPVAEADAWLDGNSRVISIADGTSARAYPFGILNYHEVVNDRIDGTAVAVTYCPLCRSALAFVRPSHGSGRLTFGVAGRLYRDNLILYDRQTGTYWSQLQARPIVGPLVGSGMTLERRALDIMRWSDWRAQYPDGRVLARPTDGDALGGKASYTRPTVPTGMARGRASSSSGRFLFDYTADPYAEYATDPEARSDDFDDERLSPKTVVIGIDMGGSSAAIPQSLLSPGASIELSVNGQTVLVTQDDHGQVRARTVDEGERGKELSVVTAYWFAWLSFHPETTVSRMEERQR